MTHYLIVDGYNLIHQWLSSKEIETIGLEEARNRLVEKIRNYNGYAGYSVILVFDAYTKKQVEDQVQIYEAVEVVYTKKNVTADSYIEKLVYGITRPDTVKVVTSDGNIQSLVLALGGTRVSSREFVEELRKMDEIAEKDTFLSDQRNALTNYVDGDLLKQLDALRKGKNPEGLKKEKKSKSS
ncbi:MAG: NYN domain-containing protein [Eubacteriaceae bacterium]|nr:NYN domain-containing protein [Eubacteriaceae bacterium]